MFDLDIDTITWIWFGVGLALMISELFVPSIFVVFLGLGAILVAILRWIGITDLGVSFIVWAALSLALVVGLRRIVRRLFPSSTSYRTTEEDVESVGKIVEVVEQINDREPIGRIRYRGTTWQALTEDGQIPVGKKARLLYRSNLVWIVEECNELDAPLSE